MFIREFSVEGVGRFTGAAYVDGFEHGVNVLAAGNEAGKSTLFKAIRSCLFSRHVSKSQDIQDLASDGSQLPATVQLTFSHSGRTYVIRKSFLRSPCARLTEDGREIARGKQADEAVWDILGVRPGGGRTADDGAFGLLWVSQGASFAAPVLGGGASDLLNAAIESEVGALVGGDRARRIVQILNTELRSYLTNAEHRARTDGPLGRAVAELDHWSAVEAEHANKLAAMEAQFGELAGCRRRRRELKDPAAIEDLTQQLAGARTDLNQAREANQEIRRCEAEETAARRVLEAVADRLNQHRERTGRLDSNREEEASSAAKASELAGWEHEARAAVTRTLEQAAGIDKALHELARREQQLERLVSATVRASRKDELVRQLATVEQLAKDLRQADAQLDQIRIRPETVEKLDILDRDIASLDAQLAAAAAQLAVDVTPEGVGQVRIDDVRIDDERAASSRSVPVLAPVRISVADMAVVTVTPAAHPRLGKRQELDRERSELLTVAGVGNVANAHALLSRRRDLEAERKAVLTQLKALKVGGDPDAAIGKLKDTVAGIEAAIRDVMADTQHQRLPTMKEIDEERVALAQERTGLEARRGSLAEARARQQEALESVVAERSGVESRLKLLRKAIAGDVALCPDGERKARHAALAAEVTSAEATHRTTMAALEARRLSAPDAAEIERRQVRCERLERAFENRNNELMQLERDVGRLTGQIQTAGGEGVGEALAAAHEQRMLAERECARIQERVATLQLLRDTVEECLSEGREHYYAPVRRHLRPFLHDLFPGAELELGDDFAITGITRQRTEAFARLSDGTQEQIAVLVRLAMGAMLAERGDAAPIILDDALVYSDDDRIERMFDALSRAGKHQQIIVLTCRLRSFEPLGGHMLRVRTALDPAQMPAEGAR
jgi:DNA repair exonuclease SbcCD ATPase subunit